MEAVTYFISLVSKVTASGDCNHVIKRYLLLGRKAMTNLGSILKSRDITFLTKVCIINAIVFSVVMYRCESWTIKKVECWRTDTFKLWFWRDSWESLKQQGDQSWIFIGRTDTEAAAPILWPPDVYSQLIGKDPDAGKDWGHEQKEVTEDEMVGWHHWLNGHESEQTLGDCEGQGRLACCSQWGCKELDST